MSNEITLAELDADLLPERQTMFVLISINPVWASNSAETVQAYTLASVAKSTALQSITVVG
jgi:hypothetical protein